MSFGIDIITIFNPKKEVEEDMKIYNEDVMKAVRQSLDYDENDTSMDEVIMEMSKQEVFERYCKWNGLLGGWHQYLISAVESIFNVNLSS